MNFLENTSQFRETFMFGSRTHFKFLFEKCPQEIFYITSLFSK